MIPTGQCDQSGNYVHEPDWSNDWWTASYDDVRHCATSVRKLKLELEIHASRVYPLQALFLNISSQRPRVKQSQGSHFTQVNSSDLKQAIKSRVL